MAVVQRGWLSVTNRKKRILPGHELYPCDRCGKEVRLDDLCKLKSGLLVCDECCDIIIQENPDEARIIVENA